eukprot:scaffold2020_cov107-Isochrysis_galbana.AAC.5
MRDRRRRPRARNPVREFSVTADVSEDSPCTPFDGSIESASGSALDSSRRSEWLFSGVGGRCARSRDVRLRRAMLPHGCVPCLGVRVVWKPSRAPGRIELRARPAAARKPTTTY